MNPERMVNIVFGLVCLVAAIALLFVVDKLFLPHGLHSYSDQAVFALEVVVITLILGTYILGEVFHIKKAFADDGHAPSLKWGQVFLLLVGTGGSWAIYAAMAKFMSVAAQP